MSKKLKIEEHAQLPRQPKALLRQCLPGALVRIVELDNLGEPHLSIALLVKWVRPYKKGAGRKALVMVAGIPEGPSMKTTAHDLIRIDRDQIAEWTNPIPIDNLTDISGHESILWIGEQPTV